MKEPEIAFPERPIEHVPEEQRRQCAADRKQPARPAVPRQEQADEPEETGRESEPAHRSEDPARQTRTDSGDQAKQRPPFRRRSRSERPDVAVVPQRIEGGAAQHEEGAERRHGAKAGQASDRAPCAAGLDQRRGHEPEDRRDADLLLGAEGQTREGARGIFTPARSVRVEPDEEQRRQPEAEGMRGRRRIRVDQPAGSGREQTDSQENRAEAEALQGRQIRARRPQNEDPGDHRGNPVQKQDAEERAPKEPDDPGEEVHGKRAVLKKDVPVETLARAQTLRERPPDPRIAGRIEPAPARPESRGRRDKHEHDFPGSSPRRRFIRSSSR